MAQATKTMNDQDYLQRYGDQLNPTTKRAKWISGLDEHEDHDGQTLATRNHEVIRHWAEDRNAAPSTVEGTGPGGRPGVLRFDFEGYGSGGRLVNVSWDEWFRTFDERELVFLYQEHLKSGAPSNFFKFDSPHREGE